MIFTVSTAYALCLINNRQFSSFIPLKCHRLHRTMSYTIIARSPLCLTQTGNRSNLRNANLQLTFFRQRKRRYSSCRTNLRTAVTVIVAVALRKIQPWLENATKSIFQRGRCQHLLRTAIYTKMAGCTYIHKMFLAAGPWRHDCSTTSGFQCTPRYYILFQSSPHQCNNSSRCCCQQCAARKNRPLRGRRSIYGQCVNCFINVGSQLECIVQCILRAMCCTVTANNATTCIDLSSLGIHTGSTAAMLTQTTIYAFFCIDFHTKQREATDRTQQSTNRTDHIAIQTTPNARLHSR